MMVVLIILKVGLLGSLVVGPVLIGRQLFQAMRGQAQQPAVAVAAEDEAA